MVGMGFLQCGQAIGAVSMFILGLSLCGFQFSGFIVNILDIAPRYAGVMYGVSSSLAALAGVAAPIIVDFITVDVRKLRQIVLCQRRMCPVPQLY